MPKPSRIELLASVVLAIALFGLGGCATTDAGVDEAAFEQNIQYEVTPSAEITQIAYCIKPYKGADRLHMSITVKNKSAETKRFRVNIFLPDGTSAGGLYPRKVKDDVAGVPAGEELTQEFPMLYNQLPSGFTILIKEIG
ncbi:hypothetical protein [uncultured Desulfosarcina sp.]|uniref:hypothetical protein n=1 Tax=uncultured Desulfosarcina sp. TaxID=218289 RepID=UPI0029C87C21|nr:hypothetical protein [uncultured Desulfosarcina sp.]